MNIYLVSRTDDWSWDYFVSFVCFAPDEETALEIIPESDFEAVSFWKSEEEKPDFYGYGSWTERKNRKCELLGVGNSDKIRIVCASFNAG